MPITMNFIHIVSTAITAPAALYCHDPVNQSYISLICLVCKSLDYHLQSGVRQIGARTRWISSMPGDVSGGRGSLVYSLDFTPLGAREMVYYPCCNYLHCNSEWYAKSDNWEALFVDGSGAYRHQLNRDSQLQYFSSQQFMDRETACYISEYALQLKIPLVYVRHHCINWIIIRVILPAT
ncbi:hypothetical protein BDD12DRAFT_810322 [Trichophaea hybrida]|nr:hypothetical protein BDD12DRAFT_810322 [Trichophaea hybrida]